eukprot:5238595-Ditylum_brightwellii.AAC.1
MEAWLQDHQNELPDDVPTELITKALALVMKSNVFSFGDTWCVQLIRVAMGTPCPCIITVLWLIRTPFSSVEIQKMAPRIQEIH